MTTIPSTPAKGKTLTEKPLPVRFIQVLDRDSELEGRFMATMAYVDGEFLAKHGWHLQPQHTYTLLPPHLAEQWEELRKAENEAAKWIVGFFESGIVASPDAIKSWRQRRAALSNFESTNGIGGEA